MAEHPILFTGEMVRAILDGCKTQTRRIAKLPENWHRGYGAFETNPNGSEEFIIHGDCGTETTYCPHGKVGDTLWVKETWQKIGDYPVCYRAGQSGCGACPNHTWRPNIHMFRKYARIFLEITNIRVERVQDISESDAEAEGTNCDRTYREDFRHLWDSINAKRGYGWAKNPWVWVIEFKKGGE